MNGPNGSRFEHARNACLVSKQFEALTDFHCGLGAAIYRACFRLFGTPLDNAVFLQAFPCALGRNPPDVRPFTKGDPLMLSHPENHQTPTKHAENHSKESKNNC